MRPPLLVATGTADCNKKPPRKSLYKLASPRDLVRDRKRVISVFVVCLELNQGITQGKFLVGKLIKTPNFINTINSLP